MAGRTHLWLDGAKPTGDGKLAARVGGKSQSGEAGTKNFAGKSESRNSKSETTKDGKCENAVRTSEV
jgi:hypothetical protein